jgi:hypothetical protein
MKKRSQWIAVRSGTSRVFSRLLEAESAQLNYILSWRCKKFGANKPTQKFHPTISQHILVFPCQGGLAYRKS